jgi:NADH-quinone oxidoreductase subunit D
MKEKLNEDGSELSILNLVLLTLLRTDFPKRFIDGRGTYLEAEPTIGYIHRAFEKLQKTDLLPNNPLQIA